MKFKSLYRKDYCIVHNETLQYHLNHTGLDFFKFSVHFAMSSLRYTIGIPLEFSKILVPY